MKAGNKNYEKQSDLPSVVPVFPLAGALLLPGTQLPLNLFEPRYLSMFDDALAGHRLIGMIQPVFDGDVGRQDNPNLCNVGCLGRIVSFAESADGRYIISLQGVVRFRIIEEINVDTAYRQCRIEPFAEDLFADNDAEQVNRDELLATFKAYLDANELEADWDSVRKASNGSLVNALSVMSPYGPAEKQALLEADNLKSRAETLVAITEMALAREDESKDFTHRLQ